MSKEKTVFPYIPNSVPEVKAQMLREVGARDVMDLYVEVPERLRFKRKLRLPQPILDEYALKTTCRGPPREEQELQGLSELSWERDARSTSFLPSATK